MRRDIEDDNEQIAYIATWVTEKELKRAKRKLRKEAKKGMREARKEKP